MVANTKVPFQQVPSRVEGESPVNLSRITGGEFLKKIRNGALLTLGVVALLGSSAVEASQRSSLSRLVLPGDRVGMSYINDGSTSNNGGTVLNVTLICRNEQGVDISGSAAGDFLLINPQQRRIIIDGVEPQLKDYAEVHFVSDSPADRKNAHLVGIYGTDSQSADQLLWLNPGSSGVNLNTLRSAGMIPFQRDYWRGPGNYDVVGGCQDVMEDQNGRP